MSWLRSRPFAFALLLLLALTCSSCGSDSTDPERVRDVNFELFPSTHQLSVADTASLKQVGADGTLVFAAAPAVLSDLAEGDVVLAGISEATPYGLLRVVRHIEPADDGGLVLRTVAAPLQAAFRKLHARVVDSSTPFSKGATFTGRDRSPLSLPFKPQFTIAGDLGDHQNYKVVVFDGDGNTDTANDQVLIDATLGGGFRYALGIDMDWGTVENMPKIVRDCLLAPADILTGELPSCKITDLLPELELSFEVAPHIEAALAVSGSASVGFDEDFDVGTITLPPFSVGPLVFVPNADIVATISGQASARFSASVHANIEVSSKAVLSSKTENTKLVPFTLKKLDADADTPEVDLYAQASAKAGVRFVLALYGVVGQYARVSAGATLIANPVQDPCWDLHVGVDTQLGVIVKTPSLPVIGAYTFLDWNTGPISLFDQSLAHGTCELTPEGATAPPGGGPSALRLQKPSFTPWAKLLGLPASGADLSSVFALPTGFPNLTPSIDGRYVASGGAALGLVKFDSDGTFTWQSSALDAQGRALASLGSVASADAGLITLYRPVGFGSFVVTKQGQSGALERTVELRLPDDCGASPQALVQDPSGGGVVVGECPRTQSAWLVRLDRALNVLDSQQIHDRDTSTTRLTPTALLRQGDDLVIAGQLVRTAEVAGNLAFFLRLGPSLAASVSTALACPEQLGLYPTAAISSSAGSVTLIGDASGLGFVARVKADGELGFAHFPNLGGGVQTGFSPNSVVELPTTGLVLASTVSGEGDNPTDVILLGLDGNGRTQWGREYFLRGQKAGTLRAIGWPSALVTDDGGVLVTATAGPEGKTPGELLAMKVFAKDGALPDDSLISNAPLTPQESDLAIESRPLKTDLAPLAVTSLDLP